MKKITFLKEGLTLESGDDLSNPIIQNIIEKNRYINVETDFWYEHILEDVQYILENMGFVEPKIYFSGFYSQGDGACFSAEYYGYDKNKILELKDYAPKDKELHEFIDKFLDFEVDISENSDV